MNICESFEMPQKKKIVEVGDICEFINGHGFKASDWRSEGLPIIRIQNINGSRDFNYYNGQINEKWIVNPGDILFAWAGVKGVSFGPTIWNGPKGLLNQHIYKVVPAGDYNKRWLYAVLERVTAKIEAKAHGFKTSLVHVHKKDITSQKIELPDRAHQDRISTIIFTWDTAIEKTELLIAAKEEVKKGLMQRLLTGKVRLGGRKNAALTEDKWFSTPADWKRVKIGAVAKEVSKKNSNSDDLPVLSCTKHHGLVDSLAYFDKQVFSKDTSTYKVVEQGQFAYATNHIEEGSIGYQDLYPKVLISPMYIVFKTDPKKIHDGYLYKILKTETYRRIFAINTNASVDRRGSLRWKDFAKLPIPLPDLQEQEEIHQVLETAQQEITLLQKKLDLLKKQKRGLMQKLLTGQWRVKVSEEVKK